MKDMHAHDNLELADSKMCGAAHTLLTIYHLDKHNFSRSDLY